MTYTRLDSPTLDAVDRPRRTATAETAQDAEARRIAVEFEALLLTQLTAALGPSSDEEEGDMFRSGATDMYRQMFSEQLAQTMAKSGGIGLADSILGQLRKKQGTEPQTPALKNNAAAEAMRAIKTAAAEVTASPNVSGETRRADSLNDAPRAESLDPHAPVSKTNFRTSSGASLSSAADRYPDAVLISEASPASGPRFEPFSRNPARPKASANEAPLTDPALATRPRRVFPTPPDADVTSLPAARAFEAPGVAGGSHRPFEPVEFQMPVRGRVSSNFGTRRDPFHGRRRSHTGVDIVAPLGTPVGAAAHGTVVFAGRDGGYGNTVVLEHADGRRTRYAHAERLYVSAGEHVAAGQVIAAVGSTGRSTGPHLHFEVIERGRHANPLKALINASTLAGR